MNGKTSQEAGAKVGGLFNLVLIMSTRVRELKRGHAQKVNTNAGLSLQKFAFKIDHPISLK